MQHSTEVVHVDISDRVATITMCRPHVRNALSAELRRELPLVVRTADQNVDVDVIVLTGADPAFCAGLDLKELSRTEPTGEPAEHRLRGPLPPTSKPLIGAVNGAAVTGGLELALACDWLVASERAFFADTHARVGVMPSWGLTVLLPEAVGTRRARQMSASGNFVDAWTAMRWGLVNDVVPHEDLLPACRALAADIVSNDQRGVVQMMATYDELEVGDAATAWEREAKNSSEFRRMGHGSPADVERRRTEIIQRGRSQNAGATR